MRRKITYPYVQFYQKEDVFWVRVALRGGIVGVMACNRSGHRAPPPRRALSKAHRIKVTSVPLTPFTGLNAFAQRFLAAYGVDYNQLDLYT